MIDLVGYMDIPGYDPRNSEHVKMAAARLQQEDIRPPVTKKKEAALDPLLWRKYLPPSQKVIEYAKTRGLTEETLRKYRIGEARGAMAIPFFQDGLLKGIKFRSLAERPRLRYWSAKGSVASLFNHDMVAFTDKPVAVLKGEIPVMLFDQLGILAAAPTTGEGRGDMSEWAHLFAFAKKVVVIGDNDRDPEVRRKITAATEKRAEQLKAELRFPPEKYKDIDEYILAEPDAIQVIREWLNLST